MLLETKVLLDRAIPLEKAGEWNDAIVLCQEVYRRSIDERDIDNLIEAVLRTGICHRQLGNADLAADYLTLSHTLAELQNDDGRASRALNGLAALHHVHGELERAGEIYSHAREIAQRGGDVLTVGSIEQNLGTLANIRGDLPEALQHYEAALRCYEKVNHERGASLVLNNLGMLYIDLTDLATADSCLDRALATSRRIGDALTEGIVQINRTELLLARGDLAAARASCDDAFEIVSRLGEHSYRSDALKFYGIIYRESNKTYLAETHLREAIEIAILQNYPLQEAEAQRELALVLRRQDRNREALEALNRAHELFIHLQARKDEADVTKRLVDLQEDFLSLVRAWGESIEAKDRYTRGHCQRVADYACAIAEHAGVCARDMVWFRMGAFLHDVGKTEVPGEILNKPGRLTDEERLIIERHTVTGDEILAPIPFPWDIRPMVRSHHERWDGQGYPDQLSGPSIPYSARILRIADVFDALTTNRSYRHPLTAEQALQIMQEDHGSFDPDLLELFKALLPSISPGIPFASAPVC